MIEDKLMSPFDYYGIDASSVGKPWLNVDGGAGIHHHLMVEVLPTLASESWLKKFIVSHYRWKLSIWSSGNERISADMCLPITTVKQYEYASGTGSVSGSTFNPASSTGNADSKVGGTQGIGAREREVLVFDLDCASLTLSESLGETSKGKTLDSNKKKKAWVPGDGVHLVIELVHEVSGIPVSRGTVNLKPREELDPSYFRAASSDPSKSSGQTPQPFLPKAGPLTYNQCYSIAVPVTTSDNRTTGLEASIKRASSGADMQVPVQFNIVAAFAKGATRATQWGVRKINDMNKLLNQATAATGVTGTHVKLTSFPSHVPSLAEVLPSTLRYRLPASEDEGDDGGKTDDRQSRRTGGASGRPMSPAKQAREEMYSHLRDKARSVRVYAAIADLHISEDLLELCKADRVVLTGHCVDPEQLPTNHNLFQNNSEAISAVIASAQQDIAAAATLGISSGSVVEEATEEKATTSSMAPAAAAAAGTSGGTGVTSIPHSNGASKVMHPTPLSHPSARPTALAEMSSNNVGDYHRCCELLTPTLEGHLHMQSGGRSSNAMGIGTHNHMSHTEMGPERSLTSLYPSRGHLNDQSQGHRQGLGGRPRHHTDCVPRIVQLGLMGFSCVGDNTQLMREHIKFTHKSVELCSGQLTLEDLVVRDDGEERDLNYHRHEDDDNEDDFTGYEAGAPLVSGLYRVPMYTEPTRVVIGSKPSSGAPTGVLVGEIFVHIAVQRDAGLDVHRLHSDPHYPGNVNISPNPGSPSHHARGGGIYAGGAAGGLLPPPTLQASQTPEAVAARLMDMLESPRSLTAHRVLLCVSGDSVHVLKAEDKRERMRAAGVPLPYDEDEDEEEEEDLHDSGETEEGGSVITSPLLPSLLSMFTRLFVPLSASAIIDLIVTVEARLREVGPAAAGATVGAGTDDYGNSTSLISPRGALFVLLMMLLERLMVDERNCDSTTVELISRAIDDRGASSVLWHYFQACLRVDTVGAILSLVKDHDEVMQYVDKGHIFEEERDDAPSAPTALTWRQLRVACFSLRVLAATAWVDRNPRVGDVKDSILAGLPPPPPLKMDGQPGVGMGGGGGSKQRALTTSKHANSDKKRRSTIGRRASSQALNRRLSSNVVSHQGSPAPLPQTRRRRSSATHSVHPAVTMPKYAEQGRGDSDYDDDDDDDDDEVEDDDEEDALPYYHTTDSHYHAGGDSHTISLCKDLTVLLLSYARRLSISLLHEYRVCEVTVSEHSETYRDQGQEDFAEQALRELDNERVETCLEIMSIVRHTVQCVSCLWTLFKPSDLDKEMMELLLALVKVLPVTPLVREDSDDPEDMEENYNLHNEGEEHEDEDDAALRQQKLRRLHYLVNSVVALVGQLTTSSILRHCSDLEVCGKVNVRRFTETAIFAQIQSEGKYSARTASEPIPHFSSPTREALADANLHPHTRAMIEAEYGKGQLLSSLVALYAAFTSRVYAPVSARKKIDDSIDPSPTAALSLHLIAGTIYSCFRRRLHLPSESIGLRDKSSQGLGDSLGQVSALMPRGERRKNRGKSTKEMAPSVQRIRSASLIPGGGQAMIATLPGAEGSQPGSPLGSPGSRGAHPGSPSAFQYNIPSTNSSASGWAGFFPTQAQAEDIHSYRQKYYEEDGQRVLFGNEAIIFVAERHEMLKAIMSLLGTASGASTRTSTSAMSRKTSAPYTTPDKSGARGGSMYPTHLVASGAVIRECVHHLKKVSEISELLLSAALHAVDGHNRKGMKSNTSVRRALFLEKGSSEGGVGSSFVLLLMLIITNTREYWREIRRLHILKGDAAITSATDGPSIDPRLSQQTGDPFATFRGSRRAQQRPFTPVPSPVIAPLILAPDVALSARTGGGSFGSLHRSQCSSLHEKLERDTSILVDAASALMTRPEVDKDLSPRETRVYHRHRTRYRTLAHAVAVAAGLTEGNPPPIDAASAYADGAGHVEDEEDIGVSIVTWLTLRQRLINTIAVVTDIASSMKLFSASSIQTQAEAELYEILIGNKPLDGGGGGEEEDSDEEPKLSTHKESLRGTKRNGRTAFINRMEALRKLALLHFHGQEEHGVGGTSSGAILAGGDMIPLTRLIWLLRDLSDLSPLLDTRPDIALLALSDDNAVRNVLRALVQASLAVPVHIDEDSSIDKAGHHDAKQQNELFVHAFHHRYHQHQEDSMHHHRHQGHHAHSHISNDRTRVRNRVAIALHQARQDLISAAVTIMQILTTDAAAGAGNAGAAGAPPPPMRHETYFQSLVDALVLRCIPSKIAVSPESTIGVILGQAHDLTPQGRRAGGRLDHHHYQYGGYNAQTSTGSAPRCAATITTIIETLSAAHVQGAGIGNEGESQEETVLSPDALAALLRLRNRLVMRLQAVRMYVLAKIRTMCFKQNPRNSVVNEAGRVLNKQYSQLAAAAALNNLLHMSPVTQSYSSTSALVQIPIAGWALGGIERRLVLMEMASLTEQPLGDGQGLAWHMRKAEHGEGHPTGSLSVEGVPLDMVPARWDGKSLESPPPTTTLSEEAEAGTEGRGVGGSIKENIKEKAKVWNAIAQREENEQRARHLRLVLPPCPARSTSSGHGAAAKLLLLALFRSKMLPISAVSATAEEYRANRVGPMTNNAQIGPVSHFESKQTRAVLAALLESGDWEIGLSLASIFQSAFSDKVEGMTRFLASMGGGRSSSKSHGFGFGASHTSLPQGVPQNHNQQYMAHMRHLLDRATKLAEETAHSEDLLKRNLLHEGDSRLLPMYYSVRITACPWTRAPNLASPFNPSPFDKADQAKMEALLAATGMELVGVVLGGDDDDHLGDDDGTSVNESRSEGQEHKGLAEHAHAGNTSLRGTWLLLRFDASAQKSAGHHMRVWSSDVAHYVPPSPAVAKEQVHVAPPPALHATGVGGEISESDDDSELSSAAPEPTPPTEHLEPAPGAPLPPTARAVIERSFQLAFPHHMVIPADYLAAPASPIPPPHPSSVATPHAAGLNATTGGSSYHTSAVSGAENASKVIQVFDAFPAPLVDEYYIRKKNAHLRHTQRKENKRAAKTHKDQYAASKRRDSFSAQFPSTSASGGNDGFGSSFDNFDSTVPGGGGKSSSPSNTAVAAQSDPFFSPGQGTMDPWTEFDDSGSSTEDSEGSDADESSEDNDHYDSSPIAKKNKTLERRRTQVGLFDKGGKGVDHGHLRDVASEDWAAASHADVFYIYVASDPSNIHHGQAHHHHHTHAENVAEGGKIMTRLTMSVLSVAKGGDLSHGHHHSDGENPHAYTHHQSHRNAGSGGWKGRKIQSHQQAWYPGEHENDDNENSDVDGHDDQTSPRHRHTRWAGPLEHAVKALHYVSPCSLLYPVESKHLTAFEAGLEIMWYQAKQVRRLSAATKRSSELTPGEIRAQSQNDLTCLDSVLSGVSTQVMNMLMQPLRNPCSLANSRSLIAGELERLDSAMQKERKIMKRRFIQSKSFPEKYQAGHRSSDFFEEQPVAPDFAALDRKYRHKKYNVNKMVKLRETCFEDLKSAVTTFRKCTEKIHHAYEDLGKTAGKPSSLVELNEGMAEMKNDAVDLARNTITLMGTQVDRDDAAQLTDTWTQITLLIESTLATVEIGTTV